MTIPAKTTSVGLSAHNRHSIFFWVVRLSLTLCLVYLLTGCKEKGTAPADRSVAFSPLETDSPTELRKYSPPEDAQSGGGRATDTIISGVLQGADKLFGRDDVASRLPQIEKVFMQSDRYLELVEVYRQQVRKRGLENPAADRLGWAYIQLGQWNRAETFIRRLIEAREADPVGWFLWGAYWLRNSVQSREARANVVFAWNRALELEPDYKGFGGINAGTIRKTIETFEKRVPDSAVKKAAGQFVPGKTPDGEPDKSEQSDGKSGSGRAAESQTEKSQPPGRSRETPTEPTASRDRKVKRQVRQDSGQGVRSDDPQNSSALSRARSEFANGNTESARTLYKKVLKSGEHTGEAKLRLFRIKCGDLNHRDVRACIERAKKLRGDESLQKWQRRELRTFIGAKLPERAFETD